MTASVFKHKKNITNPKYSKVDLILESIKKCSVQKQIDEIRAEPDEKKRKELKGRLPNICFSGKFKTRVDEDIIEHSGFVILDIDHIGNIEEVQKRKEEISKLEYVYSCFISPSGDGLKILVRIPADAKKHRGHYRALMKLFPQNDTTSINESRVCYASADPEIWINKNAVEFTDYAEEKTECPQFQKYATVNNYSKAEVALNMIRLSANGEKHSVLLKASKLMGGFISGGIISESEGIRLLEQEIQGKEIDDFDGAKKTIQDGVAYGKSKPLFEIEKEIKYTPKKSGIKPADEVWENMKHSFVHGKARGTTTYFTNFDINFTWKPMDLTLFIGRPNAGKSEFVFQLMLVKSFFEGWKWAVYSPENYPEDEFYDGLIHSYIGKTTDPFYKNAQMSITEYGRGYEFVRKHFFYVYPEDNSIEEIERNFLYLVENEKINGTFIDPFNHLDIDLNERDDKFLKKFLSQRKSFGIKYNLCYLMSAHPKAMGKSKNGEYDVADIYDIAGGAMWGNKIDNLITVHRPNYITDPQDTSVEIHVKKIKKQKLVGLPGMCRFDFSRKTNRYYINDTSPFDDSMIKKPTQTRISEPKEDEINLPF